jgi:hypothetical protein
MNNKEIQLAAISIAKQLLAADGYRLSEGDRGYDLTARKGSEVLHVEVKGAGASVASLGGFRYLTSGEFKAARTDPNRQLWIVENLGKPSEVRVTRIPRHEVLAHVDIEISWVLKTGRWCAGLTQACDAGIVAKVVSAIGPGAPVKAYP